MVTTSTGSPEQITANSVPHADSSDESNTPPTMTAKKDKKTSAEAKKDKNPSDEIPSGIIASEVISDQGSKFQGFLAEVDSYEEVLETVRKVKEMDKCILSTHTIVAYRLSPSPDPNVILESCQDDGEKGAGGHVLRILKEHSISDVVVVVVRWYGGKHIGKARYDHIGNVTKEVLRISGGIVAVPNISTQNRFTVLDGSNDNTEETHLDHNSQRIQVDNLILHDSTGHDFEPKRLFGREKSEKEWAPYVDLAETVLNRYTVKERIVLMCGVRHARGQISSGQFEKKLGDFIQTAKNNNHNAKIILMSSLPGENSPLQEKCQMINALLAKVHNPSNLIFYADTATKFSQSPGSMTGNHPNKSYMTLFGAAINESVFGSGWKSKRRIRQSSIPVHISAQQGHDHRNQTITESYWPYSTDRQIADRQHDPDSPVPQQAHDRSVYTLPRRDRLPNMAHLPPNQPDLPDTAYPPPTQRGSPSQLPAQGRYKAPQYNPSQQYSPPAQDRFQGQQCNPSQQYSPPLQERYQAPQYNPSQQYSPPAQERFQAQQCNPSQQFSPSPTGMYQQPCNFYGNTSQQGTPFQRAYSAGPSPQEALVFPQYYHNGSSSPLNNQQSAVPHYKWGSQNTNYAVC